MSSRMLVIFALIRLLVMMSWAGMCLVRWVVIRAFIVSFIVPVVKLIEHRSGASLPTDRRTNVDAVMHVNAIFTENVTMTRQLMKWCCVSIRWTGCVSRASLFERCWLVGSALGTFIVIVSSTMVVRVVIV